MLDTLTLAELCESGKRLTLAPDDPVSAAVSLMGQACASAVAIAVDERPLGIFTERDALTLVASGAYSPATPLREVMSAEVICAPAEMTFAEGYARMAGHGLRHLVLIDAQGCLYGVVSETDFANALGAEELQGPRSVRDLMTRDPATVLPQVSIAEALALMDKRRISSVIIAEGKWALGILSERDVIRLAALDLDLHATPVSAFMSHPLHTIGPDRLAHEVTPLMRAHGVRRLVVEDEAGYLIGILTRRDLLRDIKDVYLRLLRRTVAEQGRALRVARRQLSERNILHSLLQHSEDLGVIAADPQEVIHFVNDAALRALGLTHLPVRSLSLSQLLAAAGLGDEAIGERLAELVGAQRLNLEFCCTAAVGRRWLRLAASAILDESGEREGYLLTLQDRTQERTDSEYLRAVFATSPAGIAVRDGYGRLELVNPALLAILGYEEDPEGLIGEDFSKLSLAADREREAALYSRLQAAEIPGYRLEKRYRHRDGHWVLADVAVSAIRDAGGQMTHSVAVINDISDLRHVEERLVESEERFRQVFEETNQPTMLFEQGLCVAANRACLALFRCDSLDALLGRSMAELSPAQQPDGRDSAQCMDELFSLIDERGALEQEWEYRRADGESFPGWLSVTAIRVGTRNLRHVVLNDISAQKKDREQIAFLAFHDALTRLPNRYAAQDRLQHEVAAVERYRSSLAVLYLDLDKFKFVNDSFGHAVGDLLLKNVGMRLAQVLRADDFLCRLSGDEFMVVMREETSSHLVMQVSKACERLQASLAYPFLLGGRQVFASASIGVAVYPQDGADSETLMRNAHLALHEAKKTGENSCRFFEARMNAELMSFVQTRDALRLALERDEFELHYQPQVDLRSGELIGVEALVRWNRPGTGLLMPDAFIDTAEESGLIVGVGRWVLREACRQAAAWQAAGRTSLVVAVNLSAVQFRQGAVEEDVLAALRESGLAAGCLELELTESILLEDGDAILKTVSGWKALGIQLSLDDFGTGYSSLSYLKRFKFDKLKIDRSFVMNLLEDEEDCAIVQSIIHMARSLNLRTIAEGVEDARQVEQLQKMGCVQAQGHFYGRAMPAAEFERWLAGASADQAPG
ncbi:EAL domain-containing protein [Rhodocyclus purpureus]|uniref:EAL domain-containing protein n=1 Tax=Rhodocyclus purpureus TaxID=1067 RepID=UPI0019149458|nr:EAL domain-containing protein [Rhodocyclus purpureus]MBK5914416.1 hypothetical protein [Rhodocyclus purpureus]